MSEKTSWMPSAEEIERFLDESGAVLKIASATVFPWEYMTGTIRAALSRFGGAAVEKALAEQELTRRRLSLDELVYGNPQAMHELVALRVALDKSKAERAADAATPGDES